MAAPKLQQRRALAAILVGLGSLYCFVSIGSVYISDWELNLGSLVLPSRRHTLMAFSWMLFGGIGVVALTSGITILAAGREGFRRSISDRSWLIATTVLGALIPIAIRAFVVQGAPLVDDASAYQFSAELLAQGSLSSDSHAVKLFFDRQFMVNDGRMFSQYFLGWPALMAPGVWLDIPGYMNALYSALTVVPLFLITRRLAGSFGARVATAIYLSAPMLMVGAATQMSHTSCMCALAWMAYFVVRARDENATWPVHAAVSAFFCVAFFIRPFSAASLAAPMVIYWFVGTIRLDSKARFKAWLAFAVPAALFGGLFLAINATLNGSPFRSSYNFMRAYAESNGMRFTTWQGTDPTVTGLALHEGPAGGFAILGAGLMRLSTSLFGWPCSFLFAFFAWSSKRAQLMWWCTLSFLASHMLMRDAGVDTFGPVHYAEVALPVLILSGIGISWVREKVADFEPWRLVPAVATAVLIGATVLFYIPPRLGAVVDISTHVNKALDAPTDAGLDRAVVFTQTPFIPRCHKQANGWVFFRPNNDPNFENAILWANHIDIDLDEKFLAEHFPDREGRILMWGENCTVQLFTFDEARRAGVPPAHPMHVQGLTPRPSP